MALKKLQAGFTLVEMLVVVAIIAVVSSILLFNYSDFSTNVSVRNLSQEIALSIRKAQTYATSVRTLDGATNLTSKTFPGYGIAFAVSPVLMPPDQETPGPRQFIVYADNSDPSANPVYNQGTSCGDPNAGNGACLESIGITTADKIASVCADATCYTGDQGYTELDIAFRRPSPDAYICIRHDKNGAGTCGISHATINLVSAKGLTRSIVVYTTGQISVQ